ncbi:MULTISPECIES: endonuclease/exonuclease/phosphatase family protein [unclassified Oceanispirochaeta]|uniref:endonuclease/exonuclease/phosphatase family protein n=1 Tax=unclassified Oceanispirochaeta TaxID=2635722 RepID=UPI0011C07372|nr:MULTISPECIES: endonuclease/exonuclease/phosphatase family protein [unclassified Oceanispirochaeta]MBF9017939.1 endonuclease/exonuclease/phosphatase family protein [Oceanispirochaeta sp. M2]NPD74450.1 hypothetical protein [Oceanispirochaeta sp. M1]
MPIQIESIYVLDLLNTTLDEKALGCLFLFAPLLLLFNKSRGKNFLTLNAFVLIVSRLLLPQVSHSLRIVVAGTGVSAFLLYLMVFLERNGTGEDSQENISTGSAIALALLLSIFFRALGSTRDYSLHGWGQIHGWILGGISLFILVQSRDDEINRKSEPRGELSSILGMIGIITFVYFLFQNPGIISRWSGISYPLVMILSSLVFTSYLLSASFWKKTLIPSEKKPWLLITVNLLFLTALMRTILLNRVAFPMTPASTAVIVTPLSWYAHIPTVLMILLSSVLFLNADVFASRIAAKSLSPAKAALAWWTGTFTLLILIFVLIFTNIWAYVPPVSLIFRNQFYLPFLITGLMMIIPLLLQKKGPESPADDSGERKPLMVVSLMIFFLTIAAVIFVSARPEAVGKAPQELIVMTYNCQQGVDKDGNLALDEQLAVIRSINPDILVLQESDSPRISRGNVDVVRFFQDGLDYYAYFGPTTVSGTFGTAILSHFPLENQRSVYTYSSDDEVATAVAEFSLGEKSVGIICVHPSGNEDVNRIFTETLIETASSFDNVIVMGDFNMREYSETLRAIGDVLNDSWRVLNPIGRVSLEELESRSEEEEGDFAHGAPTLKRRIDYIFLSESFEVLDSEYISNEASMTDHPAHWARIRLK